MNQAMSMINGLSSLAGPYAPLVGAGTALFSAVDNLVPSQTPTAYSRQYSKFEDGGAIQHNNTYQQVKGSPDNRDSITAMYDDQPIKLSKGEILHDGYVFSNKDSVVFDKPFSQLAKKYVSTLELYTKKQRLKPEERNTVKFLTQDLDSLKQIQEAEMTLAGKRPMQPTQDEPEAVDNPQEEAAEHAMGGQLRHKFVYQNGGYILKQI